MRFVVFVLFTLTSLKVWSQIDYNKIIIPSEITSIDFQEKLVQLAWTNHPSNRILEDEVGIQKQILKQDKIDWVSGFGVTGNLNEFVLNEASDPLNRSAFYPKYNFYGRLDLGLIFVNPLKRKENLLRIKRAEENLNEQKLELRRSVLKAYQDYLKFLELFKIQSEFTQDIYSEFLLIEQSFKNGTTTTEEFNKAMRDYNLQRMDKIGAENQYLRAKYDLEYFIGVKIEDIL